MIYILLGLLEIKHIIADYFLQSNWIGITKRLDKGWLYGLSLHAGHHGLFTFLIILTWTRSFYYGILAGLFDFMTHFVIDRIKSSPNFFGVYYGYNWQGISLTIIDQILHHLVIFIIAYWIYKYA